MAVRKGDSTKYAKLIGSPIVQARVKNPEVAELAEVQSALQTGMRKQTKLVDT